MAQAHETKRSLKEGVGYGIVAGIIFALAEVAFLAVGDYAAMTPFRLFASVVLGSSALTTVSAGTAFVIGGLVHLALSALFGLLYGLVNAYDSTATQTNWGRQSAIGIGYGILLWLVNFQIIARIAYPWFLETAQFTQVVLHALFYGFPLGLMYAAAERKAHHIHRPPRPVT